MGLFHEQIILEPDLFASRPASGSVPIGAIYFATDTGLIYRNNGATWDDYSGSGGGATTEETTFGSEAVTTDGDLSFLTNAPQLERYDGSTRQPYGPIFRWKRPVDGDFTWVNQGTAVIDTSHGGILLYKTSLSGDNHRLRVKSTPATPWYITAAFIPSIRNTNYHRLGIAYRESGSGKLRSVCMHQEKWQIISMNSPTSFSAQTDLTASAIFWHTGLVKFIQFADDGASRKAWLSHDGYVWQNVVNEARTTFCTGDQIGFFVDPNSGSLGIGMQLLSWEEFSSFQGIDLT